MRAKLILWPDMAIYVGPSFATDRHSHFYAQLCIGISGPLNLTGRDSISRAYEIAYVPSGISHQTESSADSFALILIDPVRHAPVLWSEADIPREHPAIEVASRWLPEHRDALRNEIVNGTEEIRPTLLRILREQRSGNRAEVTDTRIRATLRRLEENPEHLSLSELAAEAGLSPGRFRHLFRDETGITFSGYRLWQKTRRTMLVIGSHADLGSAALRGGFADQAHFNRIFRRSFGLTPSRLLKSGAEITFFQE